jgi:hypothetical protein
MWVKAPKPDRSPGHGLDYDFTRLPAGSLDRAKTLQRFSGRAMSPLNQGNDHRVPLHQSSINHGRAMLGQTLFLTRTILGNGTGSPRMTPGMQ